MLIEYLKKHTFKWAPPANRTYLPAPQGPIKEKKPVEEIKNWDDLYLLNMSSDFNEGDLVSFRTVSPRDHWMSHNQYLVDDFVWDEDKLLKSTVSGEYLNVVLTNIHGQVIRASTKDLVPCTAPKHDSWGKLNNGNPKSD